jgi:hypothetical protein
MGGEDHTFAWLRRRLYLLAENPEKHLLRYPSGTVQPIDFGLVYVEALPGPMGISCEVHADTLARVAGFFPSPAGSFIRNTDFFLQPGEVLLEPARFFRYGFLHPRDLGGFAKLSATGKIPARFFRRHFG